MEDACILCNVIKTYKKERKPKQEEDGPLVF
jgi:hypothetical protein